MSDTILVAVQADECYPVYDFTRVDKNTPGWMRTRISVSKKDLRRWEAARKAFNKAQTEIGHLVSEHRQGA